MAGLTSSTIGRKYAMALSALFLLIFLIVHLGVNLISVFSEDAFNQASRFMETNPLIQFLMQPVLMFGVIFHFVMGFILEIKNNKARPVKYAVDSTNANSTWVSRNMIITGGFILVYLLAHLGEFWIPTINKNYFGGGHGETSFEHLQEMFHNPVRVGLYVVSFVLLGLHLLHGFQSAFQSVGARHPKYTPCIEAFGKWYSIIIPLGFAVVAVYHFVTQL